MTAPRGVFAPVPTPVDDAGGLDLVSTERHLAWLEADGLDGALILGTNGEFPSFAVRERLAIAAAAARSRGGLELMLGVGSCAVPDVLRMMRAATNLGFTSVLVPPPFYFRSAPPSGIAAFFLEVLDAAELPVLLYHIPQVTGVPISDAILDEVIGHPRFGGVKDSSGELRELERFTTKLGGEAYMVGHDRLLSASAASGGGSITAGASVAPRLVVATHRDPSRQPELDDVRELLELSGLGPAVKAILRHRGIGPYRTRPPLLDLDDESARKLVAQFERLVGG